MEPHTVRVIYLNKHYLHVYTTLLEEKGYEYLIVLEGTARVRNFALHLPFSLLLAHK